MSSHLSVRLATRADDEPLIALWSEYSGWGPVEHDFWQALMVDRPDGPATIVVAEEGQRLVGQFVFLPGRVSVGGRQLMALRMFAPVVDPNLRSWPDRAHPAIAMFDFALGSLQSLGIEVIYGLPDPRWRSLIRRSTSLACTLFPLWSLRVPVRELPELPAGAEVVDVEPDDPRLAELCSRSAALHPICVMRQSTSFFWRAAVVGQSLVGVEIDGELIAVAELRSKGDRQALLGTILSRDTADSLRAGLAGAVRYASGHAASWEIGKIGALVSSPLRGHVAALGFARDDYDFLFCVGAATAELQETLAPERWYVSGSD